MESTSLPSQASNSPPNVNTKIHNDLQIVVDKMNGCEQLLQQPTPTLELLAVIGFLEACQPRMIELVEAAAQGALSEQVLMECLQVNDRLTKILSDVDNQVDLSTVDYSAAASEESPQFVINDDDLLLNEDMEQKMPATAPPSSFDAAPATASGGLKTTGEDDLDDLLDLNSDALGQLNLGGEGNQGDILKTKSEDDFDDFISSRQAD